MTIIYSYDEPERWGRKTVESVDTPDYDELVASNAELPYNPHRLRESYGVSPYADTYNGLKTERDSRPWHGFVNLVTGDGRISILTDQEFVLQLPTLEEVEVDVSNRLLSKTRDIQLNLGVTIGEFPETAEFVYGAVTRLYRAYRQLRRGRPRKAQRELEKHKRYRRKSPSLNHIRKEVARHQRALRELTGRDNVGIGDVTGAAADTWLGIQFGVSPIVNDIYEAVSFCEGQILAEQNQMVELRSRMVRSFDKTLHAYDSTRAVNSSNRVYGDLDVAGRVRMRISDPTLYTMEQLGLTNPARTAWELVPFSFLVDWVLPVGEWIQNVVPPQGLDFVKGYIYSKARGGVINATFNHAFPGSGGKGWYTSGREYETFKDRVVLSGLPEVQFVVPDFGLSKGKVATAIALLRNLAGK